MNGHTVYLDGSTGIFLLPGVLYDEYGCIVSRGDISFTCNFGASAYMLAWSTEAEVFVDASGEVKGGNLRRGIGYARGYQGCHRHYPDMD